MNAQMESLDLLPVELQPQVRKMAQLFVRIGANVQKGQCLLIVVEPENLEFARLIAEEAYRVGARYVVMRVYDAHLSRLRFVVGDPDNVEFMPDYEVSMYREMLDQDWASIDVTSDGRPELFDDVDPALLTRAHSARIGRIKFYREATSALKVVWTGGPVPSSSWAAKIFPHLSTEDAYVELWRSLLRLARADRPDPISAWEEHLRTLRTIANALNRLDLRWLHFYDPEPGPDGKPSTDLHVGLTDTPEWEAVGIETAAGVRFVPNLPSEEVFTTPHRLRTHGYAHTSRPSFPLSRRVEKARFVFEQGKVVDFSAEIGEDTLTEFFRIEGADYLGEIALVDARSPVYQSGLVFQEVMLDENCACHMAFGSSYATGIRGGGEMSKEELAFAGANDSAVHADFMIGTATMRVTATTGAGDEIPLMVDGRFSQALLAGS